MGGESPVNVCKGELVFIPQKTRGSVSPSSPGALTAPSLSLCVLTQPSSRLPTLLPPGATPSVGSARLLHMCARQKQAKRAAHLLESILTMRMNAERSLGAGLGLAWPMYVRSCNFPVHHGFRQRSPRLRHNDRGVTEKQPTFPRSQLGFKRRQAGPKPSAQPLHAPAQQASAVDTLQACVQGKLPTRGYCERPPGRMCSSGRMQRRR